MPRPGSRATRFGRSGSRARITDSMPAALDQPLDVGDARALVAGRVGGVEPDQVPQQLGRAGVDVAVPRDGRAHAAPPSRNPPRACPRRHLRQVLGDARAAPPFPLVVGERLVHVREAPVAALAQRRDLERASAQRRLAPARVGGAARRRTAGAQLGVQLGLGLARRDRRDLAVAHHEAARRLAAVREPDVVEHDEVVGVHDHPEPAPVRNLLPVAHAPGVVAHPSAGEGMAAPVDDQRARHRPGLLVVVGGDARSEARLERQRVSPGGEPQGCHGRRPCR